MWGIYSNLNSLILDIVILDVWTDAFSWWNNTFFRIIHAIDHFSFSKIIRSFDHTNFIQTKTAIYTSDRILLASGTTPERKKLSVIKNLDKIRKTWMVLFLLPDGLYIILPHNIGLELKYNRRKKKLKNNVFLWPIINN